MLKAPYPYFGGKSRVAPLIWERFGDVHHYIEPFFGSGAVLLQRPHTPRMETVNDLDAMIANFWRAVQDCPDDVAYHADWPVNESDLTARHSWLVQRKDTLQAALEGNADYYDAKVAGWWLWGICNWIGGGWCAGDGGWVAQDGKLVRKRDIPGMEDAPGSGKVKKPYLSGIGQGINGIARILPALGGGRGINRQPNLGGGGDGDGDGTGIHRKLPSLGGGRGVERKRPHLISTSGINRQRPQLTSDLGINRRQTDGDSDAPGDDPMVGTDMEGDGDRWAPWAGSCATWADHIDHMMRDLQDRLRRVRVCCGDWSRVCTPAVTTQAGITGVLLDPPYSAKADRSAVYSKEDMDVAHSVREWAIAMGNLPNIRIALCGYEGEHNMPKDWVAVGWKAQGGYGNQGEGRGKANSRREMVWFSPNCLNHTSLATYLTEDDTDDTDDIFAMLYDGGVGGEDGSGEDVSGEDVISL